LVGMITTPEAGCFTTDHPAAVVMFVGASRVLRMLVAPAPEPDERSFEVFTILTLAALGLALKLSSAALGLSLAVVGVGASLIAGGVRQTPVRRLAWWVVGVPGVITVVWLSRSVVLSGYPLFPSTFGAVPVEWRMPVEQVKAERAYIKYYARAEARLRETN